MPRLHEAAKEGCAEEITVRIEAGAEPDELDDGGLTPLYWAAHGDYPEAIHILIKAGADPRIRDGNGRTPLHWVSFNRGCNHKAYRVLLEAGADANAQDIFGWTARSRPKFDPYDRRRGGSTHTRHQTDTEHRATERMRRA